MQGKEIMEKKKTIILIKSINCKESINVHLQIIIITKHNYAKQKL